MAYSEPNRREAFTALFSQMAPRLYRTAIGILGNPHDAADALQDAGLKAYKYFDRLAQQEAGAAWLTRILINACYDHGRKRSVLLPTGLLPQGDEVGEIPRETDWELVQALQQLPDEQRTTVALRFFHDLSLSQIAAVMDVAEGTVKSRLHAALGKLRAILTSTGKEGVQ